MRDKPFSWHNHHRAQKCIAQGYLTNSKRPESLIKGIYPTHVKGGLGCYLYDENNKKYLDFIGGLGTNLLGYGHAQIAQVVAETARMGPSLSLPTTYELDTAEMIKNYFPFVDKVKFFKSGSEACSAAMRIARTYTSSWDVWSDGYHGNNDQFVAMTPPAIGVPELDAWGWPQKLEKDTDRGNRVKEDLGIVIVEPVMTDASAGRKAYLKELRKNTECLIYDEVITGFRWKQWCVSRNWGITPDLIVLGKAIANGFPLAVVAGKKEVMEAGEYFLSGTYFGEMCSLAAARKVMLLLHNDYSIDDLWRKGQHWLDEFNSFWPDKIRIEGYPTRGVFVGDDLVKALLWQEACLAGILFGPSWWFNFPMIEHGFQCLGTLKDIITRIKSGQVALKGEMPKSPFAQKVRNND